MSEVFGSAKTVESTSADANTDTFSYDDQDLLNQVSYGAGGSSTMVWDAAQQRQKLTNSGGSTYFVYDPTAGVPAVLVETDGENETFYVREPGGELIARATGQTRQYYFFDRLGSTVAMVPAVEGNPTDRLFYTPWGELVTSGSRASTVGTTANPYRYVGELGYYYHHQDPGLQDWMQLGVRFYEPELGRFERRDPVPATAISSYLYALDNPFVFSDPSGKMPEEDKCGYWKCADQCVRQSASNLSLPYVDMACVAAGVCCAFNPEGITRVLCCGTASACLGVNASKYLTVIKFCALKCLIDRTPIPPRRQPKR